MYYQISFEITDEMCYNDIIKNIAEWRDSMELMFIGAAHEVTGSCHYLRVEDTHILVDYGMEQGINYFENADLPVEEAMID